MSDLLYSSQLAELPQDFEDNRKMVLYLGAGVNYAKDINLLWDDLRKIAKVSILVFDERGKDLHLNADILIEMRVREDEHTHYLHHELRIAKSDLQRHVYGWHHYKKLRDLSIEVFPNVHALMSHRFASTYALSRLERDSLKHPQSLLMKFQNGIGDWKEGDSNAFFGNKIRNIKNEPQKQISKTSVTLDYWSVDSPIVNALRRNAEVIALLFGKQERLLRDNVLKLLEDDREIELLSHIHCWEVRIGDIQPTEILSVINQYLNRWSRKHGENNELYLYVDDIAQLNFYPMVESESLFLPTLLALCKEACAKRDLLKEDGNEYAIINLHIICTNRTCMQFRYALQINNWNRWNA